MKENSNTKKHSVSKLSAILEKRHFFSALLYADAAYIMSVFKKYSSASELYLKSIRSLDSSDSKLAFTLRQRFQFNQARFAFLAGEGEPIDDFFLCSALPAGKGDSHNSVPAASGGYSVYFNHKGLVIDGGFKPFRSALTPVTVKLDDKPVYVIGRAKEGLIRGKFIFTVRRSTLKLFPPESILTLEDRTGTPLVSEGGGSLILRIPHGNGELFERLNQGASIDKKGYLAFPGEDASQRQKAYLEIYEDARGVFDSVIGTPLILLYGTLLGFHRSGTFIPGDDDFDAGYVSRFNDPVSVKRETIEIVMKLIQHGFSVSFNRRGRLFRLRRINDDPDIFLDVRPVWFNGNYAWLHKQACLECGIEDFLPAVRGDFDGTDVYVPANTEKFLEQYYGPGWKVPDPGYSNASRRVPFRVIRYLDRACVTQREYIEMLSQAEKLRMENPEKETGVIESTGSYSLYPLSDYERNCRH